MVDGMDEKTFITIIASALGGAVVTAMVTFVTIAINRNVEHRQWERNQKKELYAMFSDLTGIDMARIKNAEIMSDESIAAQQLAMHKLQLLASDKVAARCQRWITASRDLAKVNQFVEDSFTGATLMHEKVTPWRDNYSRALPAMTYQMKLDLLRLPRRKRTEYRKYLRDAAKRDEAFDTSMPRANDYIEYERENLKR
jgi:hypothetical protein